MTHAATPRRNSPLRTAHLLPMPREIILHEGVCRLTRGSTIQVQVPDPRIERAVLRCLHGAGGIGDVDEKAGDKPTTIRVAIDAGQVTHRDGYRLNVRRDGMDLAGNSPTGCFHGIQTLTQLGMADWGLGIDFHSTAMSDPRTARSEAPSRVHEPSSIPCCTIIDWPDFTTRGLLHDITRGKVPSLATLKQLVDRLALLKVNQLQLYIEHAFVFSFDPDICSPDEGLTPDEVRELDVYSRQRFVDLVPALATFGHMGRILSMSRYRHLAEVEATKAWADMTWPERMRGLTLDCMNPEAHRLVGQMWSDVLEAFSAPVVNICGDEPWDLGYGKNKGRFDEFRKSTAYVEQLRRTHEVCAAYGRKTQFWSDVLRDYPTWLDRLPPDSTVLHWGYDDRADYEGTGAFEAAGLPAFVCPGTSSWKRVLNAMDPAERNVRNFADTGWRHGATGLINTDWGDHGHFNLLACSWHGIASGAAFGWRADHGAGMAFDECAAPLIFGTQDTLGFTLLREASRIAEQSETWRLLWMPLLAVASDTTLPSRKEATDAHEHAAAFLSWHERLNANRVGDARDLSELALAALFTELFAEKVALVHEVRSLANRTSAATKTRNELAGRIEEASEAFANCWLARNKETGLDDILRALSAVAKDLRCPLNEGRPWTG